MRVMREAQVGCLPVVKGDRLVGIITEHDFMDIARTLLEAELTHA
jgi:CBS domain-containing protein